MPDNNKEIAQRLKGLREMCDLMPADMAEVTGLSENDYLEFETGKKDFSVTFLYNCAEKFGVDVTEILTGATPKLSSYSIVKAGHGVITERRHMFTYEHLAQNFKGRTSEPFLVTAPYEKGSEERPIPLSSHQGQEMDYILSGSLKLVVNGKEEILNEGDTAYYDSAQPHGMIAVGGKDCKFLAIVLKSFED
ncbi:MAG: cupin domain-containing protein [Clostridia bacterium]|nr:cupin domain-containing protein [Clostridia bacterium]